MRAWDILFFLLVLAPFLTGGLWIHQPGLKLEYTQPAFAALALAAWLWWLRRSGRDPAKESRLCALGLRAWRAWSDALRLRPLAPLLCAWLLVSLLWFTSALLRHRALGSGLADLGIFTNAIWNVAQEGFPFSSIKGGRSLLADHQIFLLYPLGWIFALLPDPAFLLLLQSLGLCSAAVALFLLGRQRLGSSHPLLPWLPLALWLCGPLRAANLFDFHPEALMLPLFLFAAFLLQEAAWGRRLAGLLLLLAALAAKESAGPVACGLGLAWLLGAGPENTRRFTRYLGPAVMALGLAAFLFDLRVVPALFGAEYAYLTNFSGESGPLALRLFSLARLKFLLGCLLPLGFLPLLTPAVIASAPGFLMLFLSEGDQRVSLGFHYAIEPLTGLCFALPAALAHPLARAHAARLLPLLLLASLLSYGRSEPFHWRRHSATPHQAWVRDEALPLIPRERSVAASSALVPHLSTRRWVHQANQLVADEQKAVDCVAWDPSVNNSPLTAEEITNLPARLAQEGYSLELRCGPFELYRRAGGPSCLSRAPACPEDAP